VKFTHEMLDGWGLATDGEILYGSDGCSSLYHLDPVTFRGYFYFIILFYFTLLKDSVANLIYFHVQH
jgi:Glutamine cyclotransferase